MKVLVIDDEKIVLDSVTHMLGQIFPQIEVETARNGKEGLLKLEAHRPELVMTDIRMPGMSGLEFIKEARRLDPHVHLVIVTAFDQFDYAREAFKFRVEDYVLKPLTKQKLSEVVSRSLQSIQYAKSKRYQELESIDRLYRAMQMVENNFFFSLLQWADLSIQLQVFRDLLSLELKRGALLVVEAVPLPSEATWQQSNAYYNRLGDACQDLRNRLKYAGGGLLSDPLGQRFYGYVENFEAGQLFDLLEGAYQDAINRQGIKLKMVFSHTVDASSWSQTLQALNEAVGLSSRNVESLELLKGAIEKERLERQRKLAHGFGQANTQLQDHTQGQDTDGRTGAKETAPARLVQWCEAYLKAHMSTEVSLEGLAKELHVTSPYLSKIFKDYTGNTLTGFLTDLRLAEAKVLLTKGGMAIKDVGYAVGYQDPNYFVRLFKKVTGYTPSEYQKVMGS